MTYDFIELDRNGTIPLYQQLYDKISSAVENGSLTIGAKLPSIRKLSEDLHLSRTTIESAYQPGRGRSRRKLGGSSSIRDERPMRSFGKFFPCDYLRG